MFATVKAVLVAVGLILLGIAAAGLAATGPIRNAARAELASRLGGLFQTAATIEGIELNPVRGTILLRGVEIHNPPGFTPGPAIRSERALVEFEWPTLFSARPTVRAITVEESTIHLRYDLGQGTNLGVLAERSATVGEALAVTGAAGTGRALVVKRMHCAPATVELTASVLPLPAVSLPLPAYDVKGLDPDTPAAARTVANLFVRSLIREALLLKGLVRPIAERLGLEVRDAA